MRVGLAGSSLFLTFLVLEIPAPAQVYPGGYPPGGYPGRYPGGYPGGGGVGLPFPRRGKSRKTQEQKSEQALQQLSGNLQEVQDKSLVMESRDNRILTVRYSDKTKFQDHGADIKASELKPGDELQVEASQDDEGYFTAVNVYREHKATPEEQAKARSGAAETAGPTKGEDDPDMQRPHLSRGKAAQPDKEAAPPPETAPPPKEAAPPDTAGAPPDAGDDLDMRRPRLTRGKPSHEEETDPLPHNPVTQTASARPPAEAHETAAPPAPLPEPAPQGTPIQKARYAAANFLQGLPNYVCQQFVSRYLSRTHVVDWQAQDVVSAEVVYEDGRERYRNVAINGKATSKRMEDLPGAWSTGEFGTVLADLFSPSTAARFQYRHNSRIAGVDAKVYDFSVDRENSHWHVAVASQAVLPAYQGSVWIDPRNSRVLRIEMQAVHLPEEFPLDQVEMSTEYQYVRLGGETEFLLPVHAETLSCQRGTNVCSRNAIDFRNYHKYSGEATITFGSEKK